MSFVNKGVSFVDLPHDLIRMLCLSYLHPLDALRLSVTCKKMNKTIAPFWNNIIQQSFAYLPFLEPLEEKQLEGKDFVNFLWQSLSVQSSWNEEMPKIMICGAPKSGKTCFAQAVAGDEKLLKQHLDSYIYTIGVDFVDYFTWSLRDQVKRLQLWDCAGDTRFRPMRMHRTMFRSSLARCRCVVLVFDLSTFASSNSLSKSWEESIIICSEMAPDLALYKENKEIVILGTKSDLDPEERNAKKLREEIAPLIQEKFSLERPIRVFTCSAKDSKSARDMVDRAARNFKCESKMEEDLVPCAVRNDKKKFFHWLWTLESDTSSIAYLLRKALRLF